MPLDPGPASARLQGRPAGSPLRGSGFRVELHQRLQRLSGAEVEEGLLQLFQGNDGGDHLSAMPRSVTPDFRHFGVVWKDPFPLKPT